MFSLLNMQVTTIECSAEHRRLANVIKSVHRQLRQKVKAYGDVDSIWAAHCLDESGLLAQYASAMHRLATDIWPQNNAETRIEWCYKACMDYFFDGGLKHIRDKAARRQNYQHCANEAEDVTDINRKHSVQSFNCIQPVNAVASVESAQSASAAGSSHAVQLPFSGRIRLLDAGSCYNPFQEFVEFSAVGIDISPAVSSVFKSDLLHLNLTHPLDSDAAIDMYFQSLQQTCSEKCVLLDSFVAESCHVVVFSLLLEYLPTSRQRVACCQTAWKLLVIDGLLLIVTPDSKQQHRNQRFTRDWRKAIESVGFARYRYEKLQHLHCMAFCKLAGDDCEPGQPESIDSALCIPQDKDHSVDDEMLCDIPLFTGPKDNTSTEDASLCNVPSETYTNLCDELPGTISE